MYTLSTADETLDFVNFSLAMQENKYTSCSHSESESDESENRSRKQPKKKILTIEQALTRDLAWASVEEGAPNQEVLDTILASVKHRYPNFRVPAYCKQARLQVASARPMLQLAHFGCQVLIVSDVPTQNQCIAFIKSEQELSFDTEQAYPHYKGEKISLLQIGTTRKVCLIQMSAIKNPSLFYEALRTVLKDKKLVYFGGDDQKSVEALIGKCHSIFFDLQKVLTPQKTNLLGLRTCMNQILNIPIELSKDWTNSGFDVCPLTTGQIEYAALDVVSCHALYLNHRDGNSVFKILSSEGALYYSFFDVSGKSAVLHGFSFTESSLCHYGDGTEIQGFFLTQSKKMSVKGFKPSSRRIQAPVDPASSFCQMLNAKLFCCELCSSVKWFDSIGYACPSIVSSKQSLNSRSFVVQTSTARFIKSVHFQESEKSDTVYNDAYYCLSILGTFFDLPVDAWSRDELIESVQLDCRLGRISNTLAFLKAPE